MRTNIGLGNTRLDIGSDPIPRIDVAPILDGALDSSASREVQDRMRVACAEVGFMTITGHAVPRELIDSVASAAERFFALPDPSKLSVAPRRWNPDSANVYRGYFPSSVEGKEGLDVGEPNLEDAELLRCPFHEQNLFPDELDPEWAAVVARYFAALSQLASVVLRSLVAALGGRPERVAAEFARPESLSTLRFNFYPEREEPVAIAEDDGAELSCKAHVDSGLLTLLHQDERGGLQVRGEDGRWHSVEPDANAFVVNTGLALQRMTGGDVQATRHRVLFAKRPRLSIPFFFEPVANFVMDPRSLGLPYRSAQGRQEYESFLRESLAKFSEYQR
ncbi:MAG: isopenicillin N synthase family oxygenase [Deltaproteobacteria bacterium]|nr:isopenicillin N synthase family oxygenase [Deltaproteobacteria bacterium]